MLNRFNRVMLMVFIQEDFINKGVNDLKGDPECTFDIGDFVDRFINQIDYKISTGYITPDEIPMLRNVEENRNEVIETIKVLKDIINNGVANVTVRPG